MDELGQLSTLSGLPREAFADAIVRRYAERLMVVARERLGTRLQAKVSPEDVVQSAFKSFFRRQDEFSFERDHSDGLWGLLVIITTRKCLKWVDVFTTDKRAVSREVSLDEQTPSGHQWHHAVAVEPGPQEAAVLSDLVEELLRRLDERQRRIVSLRLQGLDLEQIVEEVQTSRRTVERVVAHCKVVLRDLLQQSR